MVWDVESWKKVPRDMKVDYAKLEPPYQSVSEKHSHLTSEPNNILAVSKWLKLKKKLGAPSDVHGPKCAEPGFTGLALILPPILNIINNKNIELNGAAWCVQVSLRCFVNCRSS